MTKPQDFKLTKLLMFQLIQARPLMVWAGFLGVVLAIADVALEGLISPSELDEIETVNSPSMPTPEQPVAAAPQPVAVNVEPSRTPIPPLLPQPESQGVSAWLLAMVILGCAGSSYLIAKQFQRPQKRPRVRPTGKPALARTATPTRPVNAPLGRRKPLTPSTQRPPQRPTQPVPVRVREQQPVRPIPARLQPIITVLPAETKPSLSWEDVNLADLLDIRKQRPLATVLRASR